MSDPIGFLIITAVIVGIWLFGYLVGVTKERVKFIQRQERHND